ncbi:MAG: ECF transporter S component [Huintestinicola sp.]
MKISPKKITYGGLLIAMAILLPQAFHLTSIPQSGKIFLPMHIPVLLGGFILGPVFGMVIGAVSPAISSLLTGMPDSARMPFMVAELAGYGLFSGLLYRIPKLHDMGIAGRYITLIGAMAAGRLIYALTLFIAAEFMGIPCGGPIAAVTALVQGIWGIVIQLAIIPPVVTALEKSRLAAG